jgi:putative membrane protein
MSDWYLWLKAGHIVAVVAWMAGLLYLPRLFVYHADALPGSDKAETFKVMERRLQRGIMNPAMIAAWVLGIALATLGGWWSALWLQAKLAFVLALTAMNFWLSLRRRDFERDRNRIPARTWRFINEVPTLILIAIVILVVVKPF